MYMINKKYFTAVDDINGLLKLDYIEFLDYKNNTFIFRDSFSTKVIKMNKNDFINKIKNKEIFSTIEEACKYIHDNNIKAINSGEWF